jgi:homoserine kinase type II
MAVYTEVPEQSLKEFLSLYDCGKLVSYEGIKAGVSNTNYFVTTDKSRYVLTLFEPRRVHAEDIPVFIEYAIMLEKAGIPCPETLIQKDGTAFSKLCNRPAALFSVLKGEGADAASANPNRCHAAGEILACMHLAVSGKNMAGENHFGLARWKKWVEDLGESMNHIAPRMNAFTATELDFVLKNWPHDLPYGAIHADYFPDNVFFEGDKVTGVIDFHFVCHDMFAYELAIAVNAWCFDGDNNFDPARMQRMMQGYESVRPLSEEEKDSLPVLLRAASLRFLLSRIEEKLKWNPGDFMTPHDPMVFEKRLRHFQRMEAAA